MNCARKRLTPSDVPESPILDALAKEPGQHFTHRFWGAPSLMTRAPLPGLTEGVLRQKLISMKRRGLVDGCECGAVGCDGRWIVTAAGLRAQGARS